MCRGNRTDGSVDRHIVEREHDDAPTVDDCADARLLISTDLDGALTPVESMRLDGHVEHCVDCERYRERVSALARSARLRPVAPDPAFVATVMERAQPARLGRGNWLRPALAWCGLLVAWQSLDPLLYGDADGAPTHIARHVGASTLALAIGLLFVAWKPHRAFGLLPFVGALFATMLVGAAFDVASGHRSVLAESVHLSELVGLVLVWMIAGSPGWDRVAPATSTLGRSRRHATPRTS